MASAGNVAQQQRHAVRNEDGADSADGESTLHRTLQHMPPRPKERCRGGAPTLVCANSLPVHLLLNNSSSNQNGQNEPSAVIHQYDFVITAPSSSQNHAASSPSLPLSPSPATQQTAATSGLSPVLARAVFLQWRELALPAGSGDAVRDQLRIAACFDNKRTIYVPGLLPLEPAQARSQTFAVHPPHVPGQYTVVVTYAGALSLRLLAAHLAGEVVAPDVPVFNITTAVDCIFRHASSLQLGHALTASSAEESALEIKGTSPSLEQLSRCLLAISHPSMAPYGRVLYDPLRRRDVGPGLHTLPAYTQAVRAAENNLVLTLDVTMALFYNEMPLADLISLVLAQSKELGAKPPTPEQCNFLTSAFRGIRVTVTLDKKPEDTNTASVPFVPRTHAFRRFTAQSCATLLVSTESTGTGVQKTMTVALYYANYHNYVLKYPHLPCIIVGPEAGAAEAASANVVDPRRIIPIELARVAPGQKILRSIGSLKIHTYRTLMQRPLERLNLVQTAAVSLFGKQGNQSSPDDVSVASRVLLAYGLLTKPHLMPVKARILPPPQLSFVQASQQILSSPVAMPSPLQSPGGGNFIEPGKWSMARRKVARGARLARWAVLPFVDSVSVAEIRKFISLWATRMKELGITVENSDPVILPPANPSSASNFNSKNDGQVPLTQVSETVDIAIQHAYLAAAGASLDEDENGCIGHEVMHPDLLVFVLPNSRFPLYASIKRVCDTVLGVASQCITTSVIQKAIPKHIENLALKVNVKIPSNTGMNYTLAPGVMPFIDDAPTIVFGADVTHPSQGLDAPSIAAVVASMDRLTARYATATRIQPKKAEIILDAGSMFLELLQRFYASTGTKPKRILFYRDGVSESQFTEVLKTEVVSIRRACRALYGDTEPLPTLTFMVVQKRHHTRFYPAPIKAAPAFSGVSIGSVGATPVDAESGNIQAGLVVDTAVTHPFEFDFYVQSHAGRQGLVKPTRYTVLVDENNFGADLLAELTYRQCYLYPRGASSVSMVPAAFYAHITAARAKTHVVAGERDGKRYFALAMVKHALDECMYFM